MKNDTNIELNKKLNAYLVSCLANAMDDEKVDPKKDFALLGIDSINVLDFTSKLKDVVPEVPLTIFMECKNINELQNYLLENHEGEIRRYFQ